MEIDCSEVRLIIHLGVPSDVETYVQEVGRAGKDGNDSFTVLLHSPKLLPKCATAILHILLRC